MNWIILVNLEKGTKLTNKINTIIGFKKTVEMPFGMMIVFLDQLIGNNTSVFI